VSGKDEELCAELMYDTSIARLKQYPGKMMDASGN
jgi:hypothetical protein